jgi:multiple sugar transport system ATP-binding protein
MVFQSYALYPYMTVRQNMSLPLEMRRLTRLQRLPVLGPWMPGAAHLRSGITREVDDLASSLGLDKLLDRKPAQLSGGQRQRVALGRAMVRHPKVFLMDEPLSNLDAKLRVATRSEIAQLHRKLGATFVYVTHDQVEAMTMSDRVALMMDGQLLQVAPPQQIYDDPVHLKVAEFIGSPRINVIAAQADGDGFNIGARHWRLPVAAIAGRRYFLGVRPESWSVFAMGSVVSLPAAHLVELAVTVTHLEALGSETLVHGVAMGQQQPVVASVAPEFARGMVLGDVVLLRTPEARVLVFDENGRRVKSHDHSQARVAANA